MFRKFAVVLTTAVVCFLTVGCYSIKMSAPSNADVKLIPLAKSTTFKKEVRSWYLLWGLVPLSNASDGVSKTVRENNLTEVRLESKITFLDGLISYVLLGGFVGTYTTVVDGNTGGGGSSSISNSSSSYDSGASGSSSDEDSGSDDSSGE